MLRYVPIGASEIAFMPYLYGMHVFIVGIPRSAVKSPAAPLSSHDRSLLRRASKTPGPRMGNVASTEPGELLDCSCILLSGSAAWLCI
jgi:hypothetical protein